MTYQEVFEVLLVLGLHVCDQGFWVYALFICLEHNGGPVGVIGAYIDALMATRTLESHPDISLNVFH